MTAIYGAITVAMAAKAILTHYYRLENWVASSKARRIYIT